MAQNRPPKGPRGSAFGGRRKPAGPGGGGGAAGQGARGGKPRPVRRPQREGNEPSSLERLQKYLAHAGVASRRKCEELILQGRVSVNGKVVRELGAKVDPAADKVEVDGQRPARERLVYWAVHKPRGYVSTNHDPSGRPRVVDLIPEIPERIYTIGRLDEHSVGLMLLTNDGELANKLAHPRYGVEKVYRVIVAGKPNEETLHKLTEGVWLAEGKVRARRVKAVGSRGEATILEMVLAEGKNREVRRMLAQLGHKVMALTRVLVGPISLKGIKPGEARRLTGKEVDLLRRVAAGESVGRQYVERERSDGPRGRKPIAPRGAKPMGRPPAARPQGAPRPAARPQGAPRPDRAQGAPPPAARSQGAPRPAARSQGAPRPAPRAQGAPPPAPAAPSSRPQRSAFPGTRPPKRPVRPDPEVERIVDPVDSGPEPAASGPAKRPLRRPPSSTGPRRKIIGLALPQDRRPGPPKRPQSGAARPPAPPKKRLGKPKFKPKREDTPEGEE